MSRNLLLDTQTPYAWHNSDTDSASDISVPGKFVQPGSAAYSNAYLWIQKRTCVPDASRNLHKVVPQGAVGVELVFKKSDNSEITPADVTNVTVGGY